MRKLNTKRLGPRQQQQALKLYLKSEWYISRLATYIGKLFSIPAEDLKQEGFLGFLKAREMYDPKRAAFLTYAQYWIRMAMYDYCYHMAYMINVPNDHHVVASKCQKIIQAHGGSVPFSELATITGIPEKRVRKSLQSAKLLRNYTQLEHVDNYMASEEPECQNEFKIFDVAKQILTPQEYFILSHLFGEGDGSPKTLSWVGGVLGVSRERIRQLRNRALEKIQEFLERNPGYAGLRSTIVD